MPVGLSEVGKEFWVDVTNKLRVMGILTSVDSGLIELATRTYEVWRMAKDDIDKNGLYIDLGDSVGKNPSTAVFVQHGTILYRCLSSLGMTPVDRSKVHAAESESEHAALDGIIRKV